MRTKPIVILWQIILILWILFGIGCRFYNMNWDSGALLHPDEYGLTNTLTRLRVPATLSEYFNTRLSPLSPYNKYDVYGNDVENGPDNTMRWGQLPMIFIRVCAEATGNTGYMELRRMGRYCVAVMDVLTLCVLYWIGRRLFDRITALMATALSALAVMQIQQSHFMTVDQFAVFFTMLTLAMAVRIADEQVIARDAAGRYRITGHGILLLSLFGLFLGMAISCKVNLAVLGLVLAPAVFIQVADLKLISKEDFSRLVTLALLCALIAVLVMALAVRIFQPMSFRSPTGDTGFFTLRFNPDWVRSMGVAATESKGIGGGPPSEQWAHRPPVIFALVNMVFYGMGAPLGIAVCVFSVLAWAVMFRKGGSAWKNLLIPVFWGSFFFLFMSTRFVKNNRYFLPAYPMLCLTAAWGLRRLFRRTAPVARILSVLCVAVVFGGSAYWAAVFTDTVYAHSHSRVEAVDWIYENIPGIIHLAGVTPDGERATGIPVSGSERLVIFKNEPYTIYFTPYQTVDVDTLILPHARILGTDESVSFHIQIADGNAPDIQVSANVDMMMTEEEAEARLPLSPVRLEVDHSYALTITADSSANLELRRTVLANENWDEGLPFRLHGLDPFGQMFTGITNEVRWYDSDEKREMFMERLTQADYLILPSQRGIWSVCRIPKTYPMTMAYYQALFDGELGFELAASFQRPFRLGPLTLSDLAGTLTTESVPSLPVNHRTIWAAEEAFSIYDHPPVWIFRKTADFSEEKLRNFLDQFDLTQVVVQGPRDAEW